MDFCLEDDSKGPKRSRLAIHPFPRVGRSNYATWDLDTGQRQKFISFYFLIHF